MRGWVGLDCDSDGGQRLWEDEGRHGTGLVTRRDRADGSVLGWQSPANADAGRHQGVMLDGVLPVVGSASGGMTPFDRCVSFECVSAGLVVRGTPHLLVVMAR